MVGSRREAAKAHQSRADGADACPDPVTRGRARYAVDCGMAADADADAVAGDQSVQRRCRRVVSCCGVGRDGV